ncbi:MAG: PEP/pyruvate-binding domain-containing protein [bacterium]
MLEFVLGIADYSYFKSKYHYPKSLTAEKFISLMNELSCLKACVPFGYIPSVYWYEHLMKKYHVDVFGESLIEKYDVNNLSPNDLEQIGLLMEKQIHQIPLEEDEKNAIELARLEMAKVTGKSLMAIRSNGVIEDGTHYGFHGKGKTELYRTTTEEIFEAMKVSISSRHLMPWNSYMYTNVFADEKYHFKSFQYDFAMVMMDMIPEQRCGGTNWTIDNTSGHLGTATINMTPKNGEASVASKGGAHKFELDKIALQQGKYPIISKELGEAKEMLVRQEDGTNKFVAVPKEMTEKFLLTDGEAAEEVKIAMIFDQLFGRECGDYECGPADINGETYHYFVQGRPITAKFEDINVIKTFRLGTLNETDENPYTHLLISEEGEQVGATSVVRAFAYVKAINTPEWENKTMQDFFADLQLFRQEKMQQYGFSDPDEVPIFGLFDETTQQMEPWLGKMKGFGSNSGNTTGHTAGYAGEIDVPGIVSAKSIMDKLKTGDFITVDTSLGMPSVYLGELPYVETQTKITDVPSVNIEVGSICGSKGEANKIARKFNRHDKNMGGIKLARIESEYAAIGIFPNVFQDISRNTFMPLVCEYCQKQYGSITTEEAVKEIAAAEKIVKDVMSLSVGYDNPELFFQTRIQYMVAKFAAANRISLDEAYKAYHVYTVTLRSCDLKMKEFGKMPGAKYYKQFYNGVTSDDMRGGLMLTNDRFKFIYESEIKAVKFCREQMGFENIDYENAFVRTLEEKDSLDAIADKNGIDSTLNSMMFELPSNFFLAELFLLKLTRSWTEKKGKKVADAKVKVGGNDGVYTFYVIDRLSGKVLSRTQMSLAFQAITDMLAAARNKVFEDTEIWIELGSCGNGPSLYTEQAEQLLHAGFDSVGVTPSKMIPLMFKLAGLQMEGVNEEIEVMPVLLKEIA